MHSLILQSLFASLVHAVDIHAPKAFANKRCLEFRHENIKDI
jgi:hypothetical protein